MPSLLARYRAYVDHPDPLARIANTVAMVVAGNQPFYPLYLHGFVGSAAWPAWLSLLTTPVFLAVPALARRNSLMGRALLPLIGITNTVLCVKLLGARTAVELFLIPCLLLAAVLFRAGEGAIKWPLLALPFAAYFIIDGRVGAPLAVFADAHYPSLAALNGVSVASLVALIGLLLASLLSAREA